MAYNRRVKVKVGEVGFVLHFHLYDDDGALLNLSLGGTWTAAIKVTTQGGTTQKLASSVLTVANQVTDPGGVTYTMVAADVDGLNIPSGTMYTDYDIDVSATNPAGRVFKFPKVDGATFGTLRMMAAK